MIGRSKRGRPGTGRLDGVREWLRNDTFTLDWVVINWNQQKMMIQQAVDTKWQEARHTSLRTITYLQ